VGPVGRGHAQGHWPLRPTCQDGHPAQDARPSASLVFEPRPQNLAEHSRQHCAPHWACEVPLAARGGFLLEGRRAIRQRPVDEELPPTAWARALPPGPAYVVGYLLGMPRWTSEAPRGGVRAADPTHSILRGRLKRAIMRAQLEVVPPLLIRTMLVSPTVGCYVASWARFYFGYCPSRPGARPMKNMPPKAMFRLIQFE
jgi:hypothetical protein